MVSSGPNGALLSVCIPTYNRPDLFERALLSIRDRHVTDTSRVEIIVCDNSTNDDTEAVYRRHASGWGGTRYVRNRPGVGAIENFNKCLSLAGGRWVHILHDDDYLLPGGLEAMLRATQSAGERRTLLFGVNIVDEHGGLRKRQHFRRELDLPPEVALRRLLSNSGFVRFPAMVVRGDAYEQVGTFRAEVANLADLDMWIRLFSRYGVRCVPSATCAYTIHGEALSDAMFTPGTVSTLMSIFDEASRGGVIARADVGKLQARFVHQFILSFAYRRLRTGDRRGARQVLGLFAIPSVRRLGPSPRWAAVRYAFRAATIGARPSEEAPASTR